MASSTEFLSEQDKQAIIAAIREAEKDTIGEIRVYLEKHCSKDWKERVVEVFKKMKMNQTMQHTGVLIYIAHVDHLFAIYGDQGIHEKVPENFWEEEKELMREYFSNGKFGEGIRLAVIRCGEHLKKHFPASGANPDELSNEVIVGEG